MFGSDPRGMSRLVNSSARVVSQSGRRASQSCSAREGGGGRFTTGRYGAVVDSKVWVRAVATETH